MRDHTVQQSTCGLQEGEGFYFKSEATGIVDKPTNTNGKGKEKETIPLITSIN